MTFSFEQKRLVVTLKGHEKLLGFKNHLLIDKENIERITWEPSFDDWHSIELRMPGTGAPGALIAGSFWTKEGWDFLYVKRPHGVFKPRLTNVVVIETNLHRYRRFILSCPQNQAQAIIDWWHK